MSQNEMLTVKEVAEIAGVSVQAIYNRLEKDLKPFLIINNGKKRLDKRVLKVIEKASFSTDVKDDIKPLLNLIEKQNEQLQRELEIKNKQIEDLSTALAAAQRTAEAAQALHAGTIQKQLTDGEPEKNRWWQRKTKKQG